MTPLMAAKHIGEGDAVLLLEALLEGARALVCNVQPGVVARWTWWLLCAADVRLSSSPVDAGRSGDDIGKSNESEDDVDDAELAKAKEVATSKSSKAAEAAAAVNDGPELEVVETPERKEAYPANVPPTIEASAEAAAA